MFASENKLNKHDDTDFKLFSRGLEQSSGKKDLSDNEGMLAMASRNEFMETNRPLGPN